MSTITATPDAPSAAAHTERLEAFLAERSADEKRNLFVLLLRELRSQHKKGPICIVNDAQMIAGLVWPEGETEKYEPQQETPEFMKELTRRAANPTRALSLEDFLNHARQLEVGAVRNEG